MFRSSAKELLAEYGKATLSPVEVTEAVLARIDALEPKLHALYAYDPEHARSAAKASEQRWRSGTAGALEGIPLTLKDNIATRGVPVPLGTAATELRPAREDAPAAARSRVAGAVLLAKTTMPDYGMLTSGLSSFHQLTRNPWDTSRTPGGSSAGAAAAATAGYGPLHVGTDIGGSIRLPAGWCGLVGLKPSFGRVPVDPPYPGRVVGPLTRTVADAAGLMAGLSAPDERDHLSLPPTRIAWPALDIDPQDLRIGFQLGAGLGLEVEPDIRAAVAKAARSFEAAGARVEPVEPFLTREMLDGLDTFWRVRFWADISAMPAGRRAKILPHIAEWAEGGATASGIETYRGFAQMDAMSRAALRAGRPFDFVISPTCPVSAPPAGWASPTNDPRRPFEHIGFTVPYSMSGQPAVSVNWGYTRDGQPIGLQIAGRRFDDLGVLGLAAVCEEIRPPQRAVRL